MRLRNKPWAKDYLIENKEYAIQEPSKYKGEWNKTIFKNNNPLNIEIGTGKGDFIIALAKQNPNQNYLAIERYASVLVLALKKIILEELPNLKVLVLDATLLSTIFANEEIDKIYLNFSDPWPKARHEKRRLTSKMFLNIYYDILKNNGEIHFKTDNDGLFAFSITEFKKHNWQIIASTTDLYNSKYIINNIATEYERRFVKMNKNINYVHLEK